MASFRTRIQRSALAVSVLLLAGLSVSIYAGLAALLGRHVDAELVALAESEARRVEATTGTLTARDDEDEHELREAARGATILNLVGAPVWKGEAAVVRAPLAPDLLAAATRGGTVYDTLSEAREEAVRRITFPIVRDGRVIYLLQVEASLRLLHRTLRLLLLLLVATSATMVALAWFASRWVARRALAPVVALTATAERIAVPSLHQRLTLDASYEEFARLAQVFNAMLDRLRKAFEGQRQFIADAAHEVQTPLTVIKGTIEVALQQDRRNEDYRDVLVTNLGQVERLTTLTRSLLTLAQFSGDRPPVTLAPLALEPLLQQVVKDLALLAEDRQIQLTCVAQPVPRIMGDAGRLTQVLVNLLDNALAHTSPGGTVTVRLAAVSDWAIMEVADTGVGIDAQHLPHLFERFYRADSARTRALGGTGLGLAIVKEIVEAHGGTVRVASVVGQGSTFTVALPLMASEGAADDPPMASSSAAPDASTHRPSE